MISTTTLTLQQIYLDNTLLLALANGEHDLHTDPGSFFFAGFPEEKEFDNENERVFWEEEGYRFDRFLDFFPPRVSIHGTFFWLVGRYIICSATKVDASDSYIPEGQKISEFPDGEQAKQVFQTLVEAAPLIKRLTLYYCTCGDVYDDHYALDGNEVACRKKGCDCPKFTEDKRVFLTETS